MKFSLEIVGARLSDLLAASRLERIPLQAEICDGGLDEVDPATTGWRPFGVGDRWGTPGRSNLMRWRFRVPERWDGSRIALRFVPSEYGGAEGLAYLDGKPFHAIDIFHHEMVLNGHVRAGEEHEILFEGHIWILSKRSHIVQALELLRIDEEAEGIYHDLRILSEALKTMPADSIDRVALVHAVEGAYRALDLRRPGSEEYLRSVGEARAIARRVYETERRGPRPNTVAVGHAHLDLAWMWPVSQTRRKGARTFATALRLMERFSDYRLVVSQPALYEFIREDEPELYEGALQRIGEGRWEPTGASWVEMDCNLTGAESLVRQFLIGKRHFTDVLGVDSTILWLPDVFGYCAALPQVMEGCGVHSFMTTKISWNEYNRIPYDTFRWRGIDGTEVLTHMVTVPDMPGEPSAITGRSAYTYNAKLTPYDVAGNWAQYQQKAINDELLYLFGYGDGGGGPTSEMLEADLRLRDLPGFPTVKQGSAETFFQELRERVWEDPDLPTWVGELYLEYHRGTYTSQAWIKRANRLSELLYREAELWSASADATLGGNRAQAVHPKLTEGWKSILFNQFHDILPGSSIKEVYEDARGDYARIGAIGSEVRDDALSVLASGIRTEGPALAVFNPAPFERHDPVEVVFPAGSEDLLKAAEGLTVQVLDEQAETTRALVRTDVPALGHRAFPLTSEAVRSGGQLEITEDVLENGFFRIELDEDATLSRIYDKRADREVIAPGERGNLLMAFEDRPIKWDAWDIQIDYADKPYPITGYERRTVVEEGPLRGGIEIVRRYGASTISQRILIYRDMPRIDFPTHIDWQERQTLLKVAFPVTVNSTRATFDIQWGNVERPTHWNTSWDWARFETCAHKWIDLSEGGYGVSLLNDCKYGHDVKGHTMRLTLLRSPIDPDPTADLGEHVFSYALFPHFGDWREDTIRQSYLFNMPQTARLITGPQEGPAPAERSFVTADRSGVVIETVKVAEDGDGTIVRFYEAHNSRGPARLLFGRPLASIEETTMLEEPIRDVPFEHATAHVEVRPYGITTLRVRFAE